MANNLIKKGVEHSKQLLENIDYNNFYKETGYVLDKYEISNEIKVKIKDEIYGKLIDTNTNLKEAIDWLDSISKDLTVKT